MCKVILTILAFFLPPWAVLFHKGCTCDLCINILLTGLLWFPGVIHAWYILWREEPQGVSLHTTVYVQGQPTAPAECMV